MQLSRQPAPGALWGHWLDLVYTDSLRQGEFVEKFENATEQRCGATGMQRVPDNSPVTQTGCANVRGLHGLSWPQRQFSSC